MMGKHTKYPSPTRRIFGLMVAFLLVASLLPLVAVTSELAQAQPETTKYLLTNEELETTLYHLWKLRETNPEYSEDLTTKAEVMKSAACTYFVFRPGLEICYTNFPGIERKKEGWMLPKEEKDFLTNTSYDSEDPVSSDLRYSGQRLTISGKWVQSVTYLLKKVGNPSGFCDATIRRPDGTYIGTSNTVDVGTIPDTFTEVTFYYKSPKYLNEEVILWFEYPSGSSTDYISCAYLKSDVISGHYCRGPTDLTEYPNYDAYIKVNEIVPFTGSFPPGDWTFNVRFESDTKNGFSVKVSSRVSISTDVEGKDGTLIAITESPNIIDIPSVVGGSVSDTWTWNAPEITLDDEFLFIEFRIHIEVAAGKAGGTCSFACDEDPSVADESVETTVFSEGIVNTTPNTPTNLLPSARQTTTSVTISCVVTDNDGDRIDVHFFDNSGNSLIDNIWINNGQTAQVTWGGLVEGQTYVFFAGAQDNNGAWGENSDTQSFWINNGEEDDPNFGYEEIGALEEYDANLMGGSWFTCPESGTADSISVYSDYRLGAEMFKCAIYKKSDGSLVGETEEITGLEYESGWWTLNFTEPKPVLSNTDYWLLFWQSDWSPEIRYDDSEAGKGHRTTDYAYGSWPDTITITETARIYSIYCTYTAEAAAPGKPVLVSPENQHLTSDNTPTFIWTGGSDADNHRIEVDDDPDFSSVIDNVVVDITDNLWTKPSPGYAVDNYWWRVWAVNAQGETCSENTWTFEITAIPQPPSKPELIKPIENQPRFEWTTAESADNYRLLVDNDIDFSSPAENRILTDNYYQIPPRKLAG